MFKNKQFLRTSRISAALLVIALTSVWAVPALAATAKTTTSSKTSSTSSGSNTPSSVDISSAITQSYSADSTVQEGMIVELKDKDPTFVVPLPSGSLSKILGIVVPSSNAVIVLTPQTVNQQQVLVSNTGHFDVLVSNQNGPIKVGDYITISAIAGVGMKAGIDQAQVIGKAAGTFSGTANVIGTVQVQDTTGHKTTVALSRIPVDISVIHNPLNQKTVDYVPGFLSNIAQAIAKKSVSVARIYLCTVILLLCTVVTSVMLYSGIRSGMIAVGRNPLIKKSILKSLIQTVIAGLIVFIVGIFAVYLLLKL
jgi:hypothetical protein